MKPDVTFLDFRSEPDPKKTARQWLSKFKEKAFSPLGGNLYRSALIYINDDLSWFANSCFHIAGDGLFVQAQFYQMMEYYHALRSGHSVDLDAVPSWEEDVEKDRKHLASSRGQKQVTAWATYLKDLPRARMFTPRSGRPDNITTTGHLDTVLSLTMTKKINTLASLHGINASRVLIVSHLMILSRIYDLQSLCIQVPLRFGERRNFKEVQGHRIQFAPLIIHVNDRSTFKTILQTVHQQFKSIMRLAKTPFQLGFRQLKNVREMTHIWDTNINYIPFVGNRDISCKFWAKNTVKSKFEPVLFGVYLIEQPQGYGFSLSIHYSLNHFTFLDVKNYVSRLEQLLDETLTNPETPVSEGHCLLPAEQKTLETFQTGPVCDTFDGTIPERFDQIASGHEDEMAVRGENKKGQTYMDLKNRSHGIAVWLSCIGIKPGQVVAVMARRDAALAEIILGIMKAGGIYLPIDPNYPKDRIHHMLEDSGASVILTMEKEKISLENGEINILNIPSTLPDGDVPDSVDKTASAYLIYTSGSTGKPKGVLISHGSFLNMIQHQISTFGIRSGERILQFASPSFDASLSEIFMAILGGGCLYPVSRSLIDDPWALKQYMACHHISVVTFPPSYLRLFQREEFVGLRVMITAGEAPIVEDARHYAARLQYFNAYGPTEASVCATMTQVDPLSRDVSISIGKPIPNTAVYILDSKGRQTAPGIPGELCLGGKGLAIGYLNRPELNQARFISPAFALDEIIYHTGDSAAWTEQGNLLLFGRIDDQVKVRGHRIEPGEITAVLEQNPKVAQAVTLAVSDSGGAIALHAFLVLVPNVNFEVETLINELKLLLPHYMIPSRFHLMENLPVSHAGKVDKHALSKLANQTLSSDSPEMTIGSVLEEEIRVIFETILNCRVSELTTDFFALGGDSLTAMELIHQIDLRYNYTISMRDLMKEATIVSVARAVSERCQKEADKIKDIPAGNISLNQGQLQLWAQDIMIGPSPGYHMPFALHVDASEARMNAFCEALEKAIETQPSFQSCIVTQIDMPYLELATSSGFHLEHIDLRYVSSRISKVSHIFDTAIHDPFDLNCRPLIRGILVRMTDQHWQLLLVMHHVIGDGESIKKLLQTCLDILNGKTADPISPAVLENFVKNEKKYLDSSDAERDFSFWEKVLTPLPERLVIFPLHNRPQVKTGEGNLIRYPLNPEAAKGLHTLAEKAHTTLLGSFLGILMGFLKERTGNNDLAICVPVGLRDTPDLRKAAGYFVNPVILRSSFDTSTNLLDMVCQTWKIFRQAMGHSRYPFGLLPEKLKLVRDPSRSPLVDIIATCIDESDFIPASGAAQGMTFRPLPVSLRASKMDYTFILYSGIPHPDETGSAEIEKMELILEYDIHLASLDEATSLLKDFSEYIENRVMENDRDEKGLTGSTLTEMKKDNIDGGKHINLAWKKILGGDEPDEKSNFFMYGGDSIKAIQLVGHLRRNGISGITPAQIFQFPTLGELKELISA